MPELQTLLNHRENANLVLMGLILLTLILLVIIIAQAVGLKRLNKRFDRLLRGQAAESLEEAMDACLTRTEANVARMEGIELAVGIIQAQIPECIRDIRLSRYDAFEDIGGKQSFTLALLDQQGDGLLLTGVHSRSEMRLYAKQVEGGRASHNLIDEERALLSGRKSD